MTFDNRLQKRVTIAIALAVLVVIAINVTLVLNLSLAQSNELGNTQLDVIRSDLEDTITEAETNVLHTAMDAEQLMESGASQEELTEYFYTQRDKYQSIASFKNMYIANPDWLIVPDFDAPEGFHATERSWYIGAKEHPGEVFITEPYVDADDGQMCFSVSTLLSDGETVVGMDLNFSEAQESILRMTQGSDQNAMIVTSGGLIAGYTDMSLVGERADEKLPKYAETLKRVASSQEHDSFQEELDGRPCIIFSSETDNGWYLILSVDRGALYGESYRQVAILVVVNLLMLVAVVAFCLLSIHKTRQAENMMTEAGSSMNGFANQLRESASHLVRLGDARLLRKDEDPKELLDRVADSGLRLSVLADDMHASANRFNAEAKEAKAARTRHAVESLEAPSRKVRNGIVVTLLVSLVVVLAFCISISINWGTSRMNREADTCQNQLNEWLTEQKSILNMFADVISSQPELMDDYDAAVQWLDDVSSNYPDVSLCYLANPYNEHPVIMSNGWEPGEDYRPETRPWYRETERSADGFNISALYLDAKSTHKDLSAAPEAVEETPVEGVSLEGRHILIAEDQEMNAEVLTDLLELEDMTSEWAKDGRQAVQMFEQSEEGHFDAILMDMRMPVMDGLAATREIRKLQRPDAATIPIIALTANAFEEDVKQCLQAGINAHMSKPVDIDLLEAKLAELLAE